MSERNIKIIPFEEIEHLTNSDEFDLKLLDGIAQGFADFSSGRFNLCPIQTIGAPPMAPLVQNVDNYSAQVCIKSGYITGDEYFVIKVASGGHPLKNSGLMQVYSQATGELKALLMDQGILTELRTAAAGAVALKVLASKSIPVKCIGMVGTGIQARYQLRYLRHVTECRKLLIWGRTKVHAELLRQELGEDSDWNVQVVDSADELLEQCNVIVTTTCAREPILRARKSQHEHVLIVCIGADSVGKQELHTDLVTQADYLVCDSKLQTQERGEFQHGIGASMVSLSSIHEIGSLVGNEADIPLNRKLTIFDSSGVAVQDCVVAKLVFESLGQST